MVRPPLRRGIRVQVTVIQQIPEAGLLVQMPDGRQGFIHQSELVNTAANYTAGKTFSASVLDDNPETQRVALTTASVDWRALGSGDMVTGRVISVGDRLVFVDIEAEINASIHISQLADTYINHPSQIVQVGQIIKARVEDVNHPERRISLSLRTKY